MAFHGDLSSFPLPELLQWLDGSRKTGTLSLSWEGLERRLLLLGGQVVGLSAPGFRERLLRLLTLAEVCPAEPLRAALIEASTAPEPAQVFSAHGLSAAPVLELAREELLAAVVELVQAGGGTFHWTEDVDRSDGEWVPAVVSLRELLFESLRRVDEAPDVERALTGEDLLVRARAAPGAHLSALQQILLTLAGEGLPLGRLQLALGAPRAAMVRLVHELQRLGLVKVEGGAPAEPDPVADMLEKGARLVRQGQLDAAALVASALRSSDPADRRVQEFGRMVERERIAELYLELLPLEVLSAAPVDPGQLSRLRPDERSVLGLVNGAWDVSTIVLASPLGELQTLRLLSQLKRQGLVA
ncbi:MAG TPA: DUF4388 domain-containing protein [Myxococcaceae bacterium]|nr:DUF4388 domain-containing protein [Myxococcaceae bacterium]